MLRTLSAVVLLLAAAAPLSAEEWKELKVEAGNMKIQMPGEPQRFSQVVDTEVGKVEAVFYLCELNEGTRVFAIAYNDYPAEAIENGNAETMLNGVRDGNMKPHAGTVIEERKISIDGHPGRDYTFKGKLNGDGDPIHGHVRLFLVGARLYQLIIFEQPDAPAPAEDHAKFMDSFARLNK